MKNIKKALSSGVCAVALTLCASCASSPDGAPDGRPDQSSAPKSGLDSVDPCSILTSSDVRELGLEEPGEPKDDEFEPGCDYLGDSFDVAIYKNQNETVDSYGKNGQWASFDPISVDGRKGAQALSKESVGAHLYDTMFDSGGGVIIVTVQEVSSDTLDEKAESLKIAERIAPRMPR